MGAGGADQVFCTNCGAQISASATFCRHCGARQQPDSGEQPYRGPAAGARTDAGSVSGEHTPGQEGSRDERQPQQAPPATQIPSEGGQTQQRPAEDRQSPTEPQGPVDKKSLKRAGVIFAIAIPNLAIGGNNSIYGEIGTGVVSRTVSDFSPPFLLGIILALVGCAYIGTVALRAVVWRLTDGEARSWRALGTVKGGVLLIVATGGAIVAWLGLFGVSVMVFVPSPTV